MNRRDALKLMAGTAGGLVTGGGLLKPAYAAGMPLDLFADSDKPLLTGWISDTAARQRFVENNRYPFLRSHMGQIKGTGKGKKVLLYKLFEQVTGRPLVPHYQTIGDCVSHAYGLGVDVLTAVRILMYNKSEQWVAKSATELIYAGSRIEVGGGRIGGDGSIGVWAAEFIRKWGVLLRQSYLNGAYDYTTYSGQLARALGRRGVGVPDSLEPLCKLHPLKTCALVNSWEECRDAVANGYPVTMCSNIGFTSKRDRDGFLRRGRQPWYHAMAILGVDDEYRRPGALIQNSWGGDTWVSGPKRHEQPDGSFWCDAATIDAAMKQGDSIALSGYVGYPRVDIPDYIIW
jgi:hypothetical protein